jgi:putative spermidine/putrescine transport system substrate-binding protein
LRSWMKMLGAALLVVTVGCSSWFGGDETTEQTNWVQSSWQEISEATQGKTVRLYMWGGDPLINQYIDDWVAPRLKQASGVTLERIAINDIREIINKLINEKQAGKPDGSVDMIWINGENFHTAKQNELLYGSFASLLPNAQQYIDLDAPAIANDFGLSTDGLEAPWGKAQFVFTYNQDQVPSPPLTMEQLRDWVKANPGKFTYPAPPDFNGSAFVRHVLYELTGGYETYLDESLDAEQFTAKLSPVWEYLNEIEPYLWREGKTYPESVAKLDQLFANQEIWMTMGYGSAHAAKAMNQGTFPESTRTYVLSGGTLTNTHYLAIPINSTQPAAAMVAINYLLSPEAQLAKFDPANWGDDTVIDLSKLTTAEREQWQSIDRGIATLSAEELGQKQLPEMSGEWVELLERGWQDEVAKK